MEIETDLMPQRINHLPVVAAMAPVTDKGTPAVGEWLVVCSQASNGTFVTWRVYAQRHAVTGGYLAENGHYDLSYARAVDDMLERAGRALRP